MVSFQKHFPNSHPSSVSHTASQVTHSRRSDSGVRFLLEKQRETQRALWSADPLRRCQQLDPGLLREWPGPSFGGHHCCPGPSGGPRAGSGNHDLKWNIRPRHSSVGHGHPNQRWAGCLPLKHGALGQICFLFLRCTWVCRPCRIVCVLHSWSRRVFHAHLVQACWAC